MSHIQTPFPILYTFRRCPYAMRARFALHYANIQYHPTEVSLKNKPQSLIDISPKATVPVFQIAADHVIDESIDIMRYALDINDPEQWRGQTPEEDEEISSLIAGNDTTFKKNLDTYKYHTRHPEMTQQEYRIKGEQWITQLETRLNKHSYIIADRPTLADAALFPFIRQWSGVEEDNLNAFPKLTQWLNEHIESERFKTIMKKHAKHKA